MIACTYEDRASDFVGLKILTLSLKKYCPDVPLHIFCPNPSDELINWLGGQPSATLRNLRLVGRGWNVKPEILGLLLAEGFEEVVWLDSDIVITKDWRPLVCNWPPATLVATQNHPWESLSTPRKKTLAWNLPLGRVPRSNVNSAVTRVTSSHKELMASWATLLANNLYLEAQKTWPRPDHLVGDQDVLTALLGSAGWEQIEVHLIKQGRDIAHCFLADGYTAGDRLKNAFFGGPAFVHAQGPKPWRSDLTPLLKRILDVSSFSLAAAKYGPALGEDYSWMQARTVRGNLLRRLFRGDPHLTGFAMAFRNQFKRVGLRTLGRAIMLKLGVSL